MAHRHRQRLPQHRRSNAGKESLDSNPLEQVARPERFELPTPWFVGECGAEQSVINQLLVALANFSYGPSLAQLGHSQSHHDTFASSVSPYQGAVVAQKSPLAARAQRVQGRPFTGWWIHVAARGNGATDRCVSRSRGEAFPDRPGIAGYRPIYTGS
jgi:hypothetical protein